MSSKNTLDYGSPHKKSAPRFMTKEFLLLGAGPVNCSNRVLRAISMQTLNPIGEEMHKLLGEVKRMLQYVFQTKNRFTLINQTSGNGGNEAILRNLLDPGDKLIIAIGGTWGEKVLDMAKRYELDVLPLRKPPGEIFTVEELEEAVKAHKADLLFVTHGESTGATLQKLEGLGPMCHKYNCLLAVDAVVSVAVDPIFTDRWELDAVVGGSQKAVGAPPGFSLLTFSDRAEKRMRTKKVVTPYYYDLLKQGDYFKCFDDSGMYHYTFSSNMLSAVREALAEICEEGLENVWERHERNMKLFWKKLKEIGLESFVEKVENRFHGVTCVKIPKGIDQMEFLTFIREKYDIEMMPGVGPTLDKAIRVGFLGPNSRPEVVEYASRALEDAFKTLQKK